MPTEKEIAMNKKWLLIEDVQAYLKTLKDEERTEFIRECMEDYCELCGSDLAKQPDGRCYCAPGYDE